MKEHLSAWDLALLEILLRVRGLRPETAFKYLKLKIPGGVDAIRKRMDRLCEKGFLAKSALPRGGQIFRLSHKGVRLTGAPPAFANSPSLSIAAEMLSVSALGWRTDEFLFLTACQRDSLLDELAKGSAGKVTGRLLLRSKLPPSVTSDSTERHIHQWLAELRPAAELAKRVGIIVQNLSRFSLFNDFISTGVFGITVVVPTAGVKTTLDAQILAAATETVVVEELQDLIA